MGFKPFMDNCNNCHYNINHNYNSNFNWCELGLSMKQISEEQIIELLNLLSNHQILKARKILNELENSKEEENAKRLKELEAFGIETKKLARETGRSLSVPLDRLESLFVKYNITLGKKDDKIQ